MKLVWTVHNWWLIAVSYWAPCCAVANARGLDDDDNPPPYCLHISLLVASDKVVMSPIWYSPSRCLPSPNIVLVAAIIILVCCSVGRSLRRCKSRIGCVRILFFPCTETNFANCNLLTYVYMCTYACIFMLIISRRLQTPRMYAHMHICMPICTCQFCPANEGVVCARDDLMRYFIKCKCIILTNGGIKNLYFPSHSVAARLTI